MQLNGIVEEIVVRFSVPAADVYLGLGRSLGQSFELVVVKQKEGKLVQGGENEPAELLVHHHLKSKYYESNRREKHSAEM